MRLKDMNPEITQALANFQALDRELVAEIIAITELHRNTDGGSRPFASELSDIGRRSYTKSVFSLFEALSYAMKAQGDRIKTCMKSIA